MSALALLLPPLLLTLMLALGRYEERMLGSPPGRREPARHRRHLRLVRDTGPDDGSPAEAGRAAGARTAEAGADGARGRAAADGGERHAA
ncbi:hypothetical protein [Streptomyces pactum]|uniref:hypothetical protein n=1 Tax=Streptomyces pactum TaxID=68249 RepID=UPI0036FE34AA